MATSKTNPKSTQGKESLAKIWRLDMQKNDNLYEICRMLTSLRDLEMHTALGYDSFIDMCRAELPFSATRATYYVQLFELFTRHRYSKKEAIKMLTQHSVTELVRAIGNAGMKLTASNIQSYLPDVEKVHVSMRVGEYELRRVEKALTRHGMSHGPAGRRVGLTDSILSLIEDYEALLKKVNAETKTREAA